MKIMSFNEVNDLENGQQISAIKGTVKRVFDQITGEGQYGTWWLQSFIMTDEHANEIKCTWSGEDTVNNLEGKTILIEAGRDKKDQLAGIKKEIKNKNGKRYETVKLDDRCKIQTENGKPEPKDDETQVFRRDELKAKDDPDWPEAEPKPKNGEGVTEARKHLMQVCNLYNLCIKAAVAFICPNIPEEQRTNDQFQSTLASLWIEASGRRSTDGVNWWSYIDKMPTHPIDKETK